MNEKKTILEETALHPDYAARIVDLVRSNLTPKRMGSRVADFHENDIAAALELLKKEERAKLYSVLDIQTLAGVLAYSENRGEYLRELSIRKRVDVLSQLEPAAAAEYLQTIEKQERSMLLDLMEEDVRKEIVLLSSFHEDEIGSKMTTNYISVHTDIGVRQAMRELVDQAAENDNISTIYVADQDETLMGAIDL